MSDVIGKSGPRFFTKLAKTAGGLAAGSLGDIQGKKSGTGFSHSLNCRSNHTWIEGTESAVCTTCGKTVPKIEVAEFCEVNCKKIFVYFRSRKISKEEAYRRLDVLQTATTNNLDANSEVRAIVRTTVDSFKLKIENYLWV